jgi:hypothetical protein
MEDMASGTAKHQESLAIEAVCLACERVWIAGAAMGKGNTEGRSCPTFGRAT